jgi:hypothetical protein
MIAVTLLPAGPLLAVPDLPPYDPTDSLTLPAACRLGLVPGREGRRVTADELQTWATTGIRVLPTDERFLFPARAEGETLRTTSAWCAAWVTFVAQLRDTAHAGGVGWRSEFYNTGNEF